MFVESNHVWTLRTYSVDPALLHSRIWWRCRCSNYTSEVENLRPDNKATPLDAFRFTESSSPACITAKMKGLMKGLRYFSQIFENNKEPEMQIGYPTDVKHVAHIGWDGPSVASPSWMNEFKQSPESSAPASIAGEDRETNAAKLTPQESKANAPKLTSQDSKVKDVPLELPKPSRRHNSTGISSFNSSSQEQGGEGSRRSRRRPSMGGSMDSAPDLTDGTKQSRRHQRTGSIGDPSASDPPGLPKKAHRKKSKGGGGGASIKPSRSKAPANGDGIGSELQSTDPYPTSASNPHGEDEEDEDERT